jgi:hypothetical protein
MNGFKLISFLEQVPIRKVDLSNDNRTVILYGQRFSYVTEVQVNGVDVEYTIYSDNRIDVTIPNDMGLVRSIAATADTIQDGTLDSTARYEVKNAVVSGATKTLQRYIKLLLTEPGSDAFHKTAGGGLLLLAGMTIDIENPSVLTGHIVTAARRAEEQLIASQINRRLSNDEKLSSIRILDVAFDKSQVSILVQVLMTMVSGVQAVTSFGMTPTPT